NARAGSKTSKTHRERARSRVMGQGPEERLRQSGDPGEHPAGRGAHLPAESLEETRLVRVRYGPPAEQLVHYRMHGQAGEQTHTVTGELEKKRKRKRPAAICLQRVAKGRQRTAAEALQDGELFRGQLALKDADSLRGDLLERPSLPGELSLRNAFPVAI